MKSGRVLRAGRPLIPRVIRPENALERGRGLLGRPPLGPGEGMWIAPCGSVHTFGMAYPIDLVYIDRRGVVRKVRAAVPPRRLSAALGAHVTLELAAGEVARCGIVPGDRLEWQDASEE